MVQRVATVAFEGIEARSVDVQMELERRVVEARTQDRGPGEALG